MCLFTILKLKVKDIVEGNVDLDEVDKQIDDQERLEKLKEEVKLKEKEEALKKGRPGKGNHRGYKRFCRSCFTEYLIEIEKCTHCNKDTITEEVSSRMFLKVVRNELMS
jgi:hypothetical protein